jgi:Flp pilus assembly pilin Flp
MSGITKLLRRLRSDGSGASMIEFAVAFPVLASVSLGMVDLSYVLHQWNAASKATQRGAREAAVFDPVAIGLNNLASNYWSTEPYNLNIGKPCSDANGNPDGNNCPTFDVTCTNTECTGEWAHSADAFNRVFAAMDAVYPQLEPENVEVRYASTGLGFAGRPGGLPVQVSVRIRCVRQELFFLGGFAAGVAQTTATGCPAIPAGSISWIVNESAFTLITEDLCWHTSGETPTCDET